MTDAHEQGVRVQAEAVKLSESEIQRGAQVMSTQMADDYSPPSASLSPVTSAEPQTAAATSSVDSSSGSTAGSAE